MLYVAGAQRHGQRLLGRLESSDRQTGTPSFPPSLLPGAHALSTPPCPAMIMKVPESDVSYGGQRKKEAERVAEKRERRRLSDGGRQRRRWRTRLRESYATSSTACSPLLLPLRLLPLFFSSSSPLLSYVSEAASDHHTGSTTGAGAGGWRHGVEYELLRWPALNAAGNHPID
eukprot:2680364-Rhodomonas_salina.2